MKNKTLSKDESIRGHAFATLIKRRQSLDAYIDLFKNRLLFLREAGINKTNLSLYKKTLERCKEDVSALINERRLLCEQCRSLQESREKTEGELKC